jgi:hypothetical protein
MLDSAFRFLQDSEIVRVGIFRVFGHHWQWVDKGISKSLQCCFTHDCVVQNPSISNVVMVFK